jgi:hypothetical protein
MDVEKTIEFILELSAKTEQRFAQNEERFAQNEERFAKIEEHFAKAEVRRTELTGAWIAWRQPSLKPFASSS